MVHPAAPADLAPVASGPRLLREGIRAKGQTEGFAAEEVFGVKKPTMSGWLNGRYRPKNDHRDIARDEYGVPLEAWDTKAERKRRLDRRKRAAEVAVKPAPDRTTTKAQRAAA